MRASFVRPRNLPRGRRGCESSRFSDGFGSLLGINQRGEKVPDARRFGSGIGCAGKFPIGFGWRRVDSLGYAPQDLKVGVHAVAIDYSPRLFIIENPRTPGRLRSTRKTFSQRSPGQNPPLDFHGSECVLGATQAFVRTRFATRIQVAQSIQIRNRIAEYQRKSVLRLDPR